MTAPDSGQAEYLAERQQLKRRLHIAERWRRWRAFGLGLPLLAFVLVTFVVPIGVMLSYAVDNPEIRDNFPRTTAALRLWDGKDIPDEETFAALAMDMKEAVGKHTLAIVAQRLNYEVPGMRSQVLTAGRAMAAIERGPYKESLTNLDAIWSEPATWVLLQRASQPWTPYYLLAALDLKLDLNGNIVRVDADQAIFVDIFVRTLWTSMLVTILCLALGYPIAYLLANVSERARGRLMILILLPFWTSLLVRTTAWVVLLQREGVLNEFLLRLGIIRVPLNLIYNRPGVLIAMTHILLPFMVLPIYSVMRGISPSYMRAAVSLGATPMTAFRRIYLPQTIPGLGAGCMLVFILALGYYITPALVGGEHDQMVSYFIATYINQTLNWGMASALGAILLVIVMILYFVYYRLVGVGLMRQG